MKHLKHILILFFVFISLSILPAALFADGGGPAGTQTTPPTSTITPIKIPNPLVGTDGSLLSLLYAILNNIIMPIAVVLVVVYIIYAGFTYVTAQGNPKKVSEAHQRLLWALIGAGILLGAVGISHVVQNTVDKLIAP